MGNMDGVKKHVLEWNQIFRGGSSKQKYLHTILQLCCQYVTFHSCGFVGMLVVSLMTNLPVEASQWVVAEQAVSSGHVQLLGYSPL